MPVLFKRHPCVRTKIERITGIPSLLFRNVRNADVILEGPVLRGILGIGDDCRFGCTTRRSERFRFRIGGAVCIRRTGRRGTVEERREGVLPYVLREDQDSICFISGRGA